MSNIAELDQLEGELSNALGADAKYWRENDAKFRAVAQRATYQQFEDIVKTSHLKPLEKTDKSPKSKTNSSSIWNSIAAATSRKVTNDEVSIRASTSSSQSRVPEIGKKPDISKMPRTVVEFHNIWRNVEISQRLGFLRDLGQSNIGKIFHVEIPPELLGDIIHTLLTFGPSLQEHVTVVQTLETLSLAKRFSLSIQFLSLVEKQTLGQLLEKLSAGLTDRQQDLAERGVTEWNIQEIKKKYKV